MLWLFLALISYFCFAVSAIFAKYIVSKTSFGSQTFVFYMGILGMLAFLLVPFVHISIPSFFQFALSIGAGITLAYSTFCLLEGLRKFEASRIIPAVGGLVPVFTFAFIFILSKGQEMFSLFQFVSFIFLMGGIMFLTVEKGVLINRASLRIVFTTAFFIALSFVMTKYVYLGQPFWSGLIFMRIGGFALSVLFLLSSKQVRSDVFSKKNARPSFVFLFSQAVGALAEVLRNGAIFLVPLAMLPFINALQGVEYAFLLVFAFFISRYFPRVLKEETAPKIMGKKVLAIACIVLGVVIIAFFVGSGPVQNNIVWGVNFSQRHAKDLGLDWKETYAALLRDEGVKNLKVAADWDLAEPVKNAFEFGDLDWQMEEAQRNNAKVLLVIGMKTSRWPECHIPNWAKNFSKEDQQKEILAMLKKIVLRYKNSPTLVAWQVENEPFISFSFGTCPWHDDAFLRKEVALVRSLDPTRKIVLSDSGELSLWIKPARYGDVVATTLYRRVWSPLLTRYVSYPLPPVFYWRKAQFIHWMFGKEVIGGELQAEPWGPGKLIYDTSLEEQKKTMNLLQFRKNIEYAKNTGLKEQYLWGAEWWYWMKTKQHDPSIWNEAKKLF